MIHQKKCSGVIRRQVFQRILAACTWMVFNGAVDTLTKTDNSYQPAYDQLKQVFIDLMESMVKFQDESGMWYQVVNMGGREKNYLETSGSAIMAYSIA